jgi:hypothetical protein
MNIIDITEKNMTLKTTDQSVMSFFKGIHEINKSHFQETKNNFFSPYQGDDFVSDAVGLPATLIGHHLAGKYLFLIEILAPIGMAIGAIVYTVKALVELAALDCNSAKESFSNSTFLLTISLCNAVLISLDPIIDVLSLLTRSAATLLNSCSGNHSRIPAIN